MMSTLQRCASHIHVTVSQQSIYLVAICIMHTMAVGVVVAIVALCAALSTPITGLAGVGGGGMMRFHSV